ncbi:MAG: hypothetical protein QM706_02095 [Nitrospira sp.]
MAERLREAGRIAQRLNGPPGTPLGMVGEKACSLAAALLDRLCEHPAELQST